LGCSGGVRRWLFAVSFVAAFGNRVPAADSIHASNVSTRLPGISYTNLIVAAEPWSIHVVKVERTNSSYEVHSRHAGGGALGLTTLPDQIAFADPARGAPVAAINGGFYRRDKTYAGAARGLQIVEGEVLSAPNGGPCFWIDVGGEPHLADVASQFQITWPLGTTSSFGLNEERSDDRVVLYTPAIGTSTHTTGGLEFVLERQEGSKWLPLRMGRNLTAKVRALHEGGNTPLASDIMILSAGPKIMGQFQSVKPGAVLQISLASSPSLSVARNVLAGGPVLVHQGKRQKIRASLEDAYESSSMLERHPRTAIGWNRDQYFLVVVDGRQRDVSDGMTLDELANFLVKLGCAEALNLDGGGSSTLWFDGSVRNTPCDGYERLIANSLVVVQKAPRSAGQKKSSNPAVPVENNSRQ
jgi:Phosphodiester glycosidase